MCKCCTPKMFIFFGVAMLVIGGALIATGVVVPKQIDIYLREQVLKMRLITSNTSKGYDQWDRDYNFSGASLFIFKVYAFHVTNVEDVLQGEIAQLEQVGPFIYDYYYDYFNVTFLNNSETVGVNQMNQYIFNPNKTAEENPKSIDPQKVKITVPNIPYFAVRATLQETLPEWAAAFALDLIGSYVNNVTGKNIATPFIETTVHDLVWGAESPFLTYLNTLIGPIPTSFGLQVNDTDPNFAFNRTNGKQDVYYTGKDDYSKINQYYMWQGMKTQSSSIWGFEKDANSISGSNGLGFSPFLTKGSDTQDIYVEQIFRKTQIICNQTEYIKDIEMNVYFLNETTFNNYHDFPEYYLYLPNGATNMSSPLAYYQGSPAPVLVTQPFFYHSDRWYTDHVNFTNTPKLSPKEQLEQHNTLLWVEPVTGITMQAKKRLQACVQINPGFLLNTNIAYKNTQNSTVIPITWFELTATISDDLANEWKSQVPLALGMINYLGLGCYIGAGVIGLLALVLFGMYCSKNDSSKKSEYESIQNH